jgi:hypothetical protein
MREQDRMSAREPVAAQPEQRSPALPASPAERVLALQRTIGNHAVGALVAREPEALDANAPAKTRPAVTLGDIGRIVVESAQLSSSRGGGNIGTGRGASVDTVVLTSVGGEHSVKLAQALFEGTVFESVLVEFGQKVWWRLANAMVSSYTTSDDEGIMKEWWALSFASIKYEVPKG